MRFSLLTYNLLYNRAHYNIEAVIKEYRPDIICFQEISTNEENLKKVEKYGYEIANYSNSFVKAGDILGVATFFNPKVFAFADSQSFDLPRSLYEFLRFVINNKHEKRTVLKTGLEHKNTGKKITVYNLHLPPFATNSIRGKQIKNTFEDLHLAKKEAAVIAGDFNYPYGRRKFEALIKRYGLTEATTKIYFTLERKVLKMFPVRLKLDYILYKNIEFKKTKKIPLRHSDHFPILSYFEL